VGSYQEYLPGYKGIAVGDRANQVRGAAEALGKQRVTAEDVVYEEQGNHYRCPAGKERTCKGQVKLNRNSGEKYQAKSSDCKDCPLRQRCIAGRGGKRPKRTIYIVDRGGGKNLCEKMRKKSNRSRIRPRDLWN
jgi:hypothetical protein